MKKAKKLRELDPRQRHKLRIAVKKLRYAGDFFGRLFRDRKAKKRLSAFQASLKILQDRLGALNDIQVHQNRSLSWLQESRGQKAASGSLLPVCIWARTE